MRGTKDVPYPKVYKSQGLVALQISKREVEF